MTDGIILLGVLAVIFAIAVLRVRRRLGLAASGRAFMIAVAGFAVAVLILWVTGSH